MKNNSISPSEEWSHGCQHVALVNVDLTAESLQQIVCAFSRLVLPLLYAFPGGILFVVRYTLDKPIYTYICFPAVRAPAYKVFICRLSAFSMCCYMEHSATNGLRRTLLKRYFLFVSTIMRWERKRQELSANLWRTRRSYGQGTSALHHNPMCSACMSG